MSLFEHQRTGAAWLAGQGRALLADEPGLGKTRTLLAAVQGRGLTRPLVVCPAIVRTHWRREAEHMGVAATVRSYDEVVRAAQRVDGDESLAGVDALIVDESHYAKHAESKRTQVLFGRRGLARRIPTVFLASGTPMSKAPDELFTQLVTLAPGRLLDAGVGTEEQFRGRFCVTRERMVRGRLVTKTVGVQREDELRGLLEGLMLRRTLGDVGLDVPPIWWQTRQLDGGELVALDALEADGYAAIRRVVQSTDLGASLAEIADDPHVARMRRRLGELKAPLIAQQLVEELEETEEKVVVFAHHRAVLEVISSALYAAGLRFVRIDGSTSDTLRAAGIDAFQADPGVRVFLGQNIACQTGITLTAAHRVVMVEPDWTDDTNLQLAKRCARIGQTAGRVIVQMVTLAGTLDEAIVRQCRREVEIKRQVIA